MSSSVSSLTTIGRVFWLFGMSGAGKTTLARRLGAYLRQVGHSVLMLDGDQLRAGVCRDLGFSDGARQENIRRAAEIARLASSQGYVVVAAFITPFESFRTGAREIIGDQHLDLIWADAPLEVCRTRDPKGLYAGHREGTVQRMTGLDSTFEVPVQPDLRLRTADRTIDESFQELVAFCASRVVSPTSTASFPPLEEPAPPRRAASG
jgi:adenylyl-sulfate kinase